MQAPRYACEALYRLDPNMRWCWIGDKRTDEEHENPGHFGVIRLYGPEAFARQDVVHYDEVYRAGPIFSRIGDPDRRDWDERLYPFLSLRLDGSRPGLGWNTSHVFSNGFVYRQMRTMCPQWALDLQKMNFLLEKGKEADDALTDAARERASKFEHSIRFNPNYVLIDKAEQRQAVKDAGPDFDPRGPQFKDYFVEKFGTHLKVRP
jgi:hypothetical protein